MNKLKKALICAISRQDGAYLAKLLLSKGYEAPCRTGDPTEIVADSSKIKAVMGWRPKHDDLDYIGKTALEWEEQA